MFLFSVYLSGLLLLDENPKQTCFDICNYYKNISELEQHNLNPNMWYCINHCYIYILFTKSYITLNKTLITVYPFMFIYDVLCQSDKCIMAEQALKNTISIAIEGSITNSWRDSFLM